MTSSRSGFSSWSTSPTGQLSLSATRRERCLDDQPWYHGVMPRDEIAPYLKNNGEFLVRASHNEDKTMKIVISCRDQNRLKHFPISRAHAGWCLEGENRFRTVYHLIRHYVKHQKPLTKHSGAIINTGISRPAWLLNHENIRRQRKIGEGQFGHVFEGNLRIGGKWIPVAIKTATINEMLDKESRYALLNEAKMMLNYDHPNVVKIYGVAANTPPIAILMELCSGGGLDRYLAKTKQRITSGEKIIYCLHAARGMEYLASVRCVHGDLALRNCLRGDDGMIKISDFGMSQQGTIWWDITQKGIKLPIRWMAPESVSKINQVVTFSTVTDVFSFGVLMWEIFTNGRQPWEGMENKLVLKWVKKGNRLETPQGMPKETVQIMQSCWNQIPEQRPSFSQITTELEQTTQLYPIDSRSTEKVLPPSSARKIQPSPASGRNIRQSRTSARNRQIRSFGTGNNRKTGKTRPTMSTTSRKNRQATKAKLH